MHKAQADFAAGTLSDRDLIIILVAVAALILIIVAVAIEWLQMFGRIVQDALRACSGTLRACCCAADFPASGWMFPS